MDSLALRPESPSLFRADLARLVSLDLLWSKSYDLGVPFFFSLLGYDLPLSSRKVRKQIPRTGHQHDDPLACRDSFACPPPVA